MGHITGVPYIAVGRPERWADACRLELEHDDDSHGYTRGSRAMALALGGAHDEAAAVCRGLVAVAEASRNPHALSHAHLAEGLVYRYSDPTAAIAALQQALKIARESGNRFNESHIAVTLSELEVRTDAPRIRVRPSHAGDWQLPRLGQHRDARSPLAILASVVAIGSVTTNLPPLIAEFADSPFDRMAFPEIDTTIAHLREVLGDEVYESFARAGESMTDAAMATYALRADRPGPSSTHAHRWCRVNTAAPSGVVTFLFTDIEGSTRRWEADPDAMRVALEAHNRGAA